MAKEINKHHNNIYKTVREDLVMKFYGMRAGQFLTGNMKEICKIKVVALLNNLKHESAGLIKLFSHKKNFDQNQKLNRRNDSWICRRSLGAPIFKHTKFPASGLTYKECHSTGHLTCGPLAHYSTGIWGHSCGRGQ